MLVWRVGLLSGPILQNNTRISGCNRQIRDLESEIQTLTTQLANRNTEHEKLEEFNNSLQRIFKELADKKTEIMYHDFAYSWSTHLIVPLTLTLISSEAAKISLK